VKVEDNKNKAVEVQGICVSLDNIRMMYGIIIHDLVYFNNKYENLNIIINS